jgi:WD40 repeat protein
LFSVTEALDNLGTTYRTDGWEAPYWALWAAVRPRRERISLEGHHGRVNGVCAITVNGQDLLVSACDDGTVRIWDPAAGDEQRTLAGHSGWVNSVCAVPLPGRVLLASAADDRTVRIWDPDEALCVQVIRSHHPALACDYVAGSLIVALTAGLLAIELNSTP